MKKRLVIATTGEVVVLVAVLAGYLLAIAGRLRQISEALGKIAFGVRAIEKQTEPIGPALQETNVALEQAAAALKIPHPPS